ncbi:MAG: hypothetical protein WBG38_20345, partial [Nodosilinea sp.]
MSSRSLGLGLLTTLAGSFGFLLPAHAAPDVGAAIDLELSGSEAVVESVVSPVDPTLEVSPVLELPLPEPQTRAVAASESAAPWGNADSAIAAADILPQGHLPTAARTLSNLSFSLAVTSYRSP